MAHFHLHLDPIAELLEDETVSEILMNPCGDVWVERSGRLEKQRFLFPSEDLHRAVVLLARAQGHEFSKNPLFEGTLLDGSRISVVGPPCSVGGISASIRKFNFPRLGFSDLVDCGFMNSAQAERLAAAVADKNTVLISGPTSSGKTTCLNAMCNLMLDTERVLLIEDIPELQLSLPHVVRYVESGGITQDRLLRAVLRQRPDRIIMGEVRGGEAAVLLKALNSGHEGGWCTIHANSGVEALEKLRDYALESVSLPYDVLDRRIRQSIDLVVQLRKVPRRHVVEILEVRL